MAPKESIWEDAGPQSNCHSSIWELVGSALSGPTRFAKPETLGVAPRNLGDGDRWALQVWVPLGVLGREYLPPAPIPPDHSTESQRLQGQICDAASRGYIY